MEKMYLRQHTPTAKVIIYSARRWGESKLKKPQELRGVRQAFSVDWIVGKCRCQGFILGNDVWIKHRDYGSVMLCGEAQKRFMEKHEIKLHQKFIYNDTFASIVLRGEAWMVLQGLLIDIANEVFPPCLCSSLAEQVVGEPGNCEWERFFERVIRCLN